MNYLLLFALATAFTISHGQTDTDTSDIPDTSTQTSTSLYVPTESTEKNSNSTETSESAVAPITEAGTAVSEDINSTLPPVTQITQEVTASEPVLITLEDITADIPDEVPSKSFRQTTRIRKRKSIILPNIKFENDASITEVEFISGKYDDGNIQPVIIQIWRKVDNKWILRDSIFNTPESSERWQSFLVDNVEVSKGDVVGIWISDTRRFPIYLKSLGRDSGSLFTLDDINPKKDTEFDEDVLRNSLLHYKPLLKITTERLGIPPPTTTTAAAATTTTTTTTPPPTATATTTTITSSKTTTATVAPSAKTSDTTTTIETTTIETATTETTTMSNPKILNNITTAGAAPDTSNTTASATDTKSSLSNEGLPTWLLATVISAAAVFVVLFLIILAVVLSRKRQIKEKETLAELADSYHQSNQRRYDRDDAYENYEQAAPYFGSATTHDNPSYFQPDAEYAQVGSNVGVQTHGKEVLM